MQIKLVHVCANYQGCTDEFSIKTIHIPTGVMMNYMYIIKTIKPTKYINELWHLFFTEWDTKFILSHTPIMGFKLSMTKITRDQ